jgi:peptidyl-prolyl cis-trans isomerase B (cyclophilin B)
MANKRHAAATEVTVAPLAEATGFEKFVQSYWKLGVVLFALLAVGAIAKQMLDEKSRGEAAREWTSFNAAVRSATGSAAIEGTPEELRALAADKTKASAPWALLALVSKLESESDYAGALEALGRLEVEHPTHPLVVDRVQLAGRETTHVAVMKERLAELAALAKDLPGLFANPEPPADAPRVRLSTSKGDIVVALYPNLAPKHSENFASLAERGQYDGTKFHRVLDGFMVQGGDRTSIDGPKEAWGTGEAGYTIPQEFSDLVHFPGYVAAAKKSSDVESGGHQFYITLGAPHHLDGVHTVFGKVVEGMDVVRAIGSAPNEPNSDRPLEAVVLTKATKL